MQKLQINIFTINLVWVGTVDAVESLVHRTSWHEMPTSEMSISKTAQGVEELTIGKILVINNQKDKALIIEDLSASLDDEFIHFTMISLKAMMNYRICHPTDSGENGAWVAKRQSEVMMWMAWDNLVKQTRDTDRIFLGCWNAKKYVSELRL